MADTRPLYALGSAGGEKWFETEITILPPPLCPQFNPHSTTRRFVPVPFAVVSVTK